MNLDFIKNKIAAVPDFPKPGIMFRDITPLLADPQGLRKTAEAMAQELKTKVSNQLLLRVQKVEVLSLVLLLLKY